MMFRPVTSVRTPASSRFAELFLAPGPVSIGATGDNSFEVLFGRNWLLAWDRDDGHLHLWQEQPDATWLEVSADLPPVFASPAPSGSRRWSLAFDQSARVILAYEGGDGVVRVTRWDPGSNQYVQNVSFAGVDPCVVMDASWSYYIGDSDVLIFYLSADRERVMARVQRDVYGTAYELWDYGTPVILDRVLATPYKYQILVSDALGEPLPYGLLSELYPVAVHFGARLASEFTSGDYAQTAFPYYPTVGAALSSEFVSGDYFAPIVKYEPDFGVALASEFTGGDYFTPIVKYEPDFGAALSSEFASGDLDEIGVLVTPDVGVALSSQFIGGVYEPG